MKNLKVQFQIAKTNGGVFTLTDVYIEYPYRFHNWMNKTKFVKIENNYFNVNSILKYQILEESEINGAD